MPILPTLTLWTTSHLTRLLESKTEKDFDTLFDETFAANAQFNVNGKPLSRDEYKALLLEQSAAGFAESGTVVSIQGTTEVETGGHGVLSGLVGLFYTAISDSKFLVLGAPVQSKATSSLNVVIEPTEKDTHKPPPPIRGYFDPRRITVVNQVAAESTYHVILPKSALPPTTGNQSSSKTEVGPGPLSLPQDYEAKHRGLSSGLHGGSIRVLSSSGGAL